jgi:WD40 repeat protein
LSVSADGSYLASIDEKSGVKIWRTADWSLALEIPKARGNDLCFHPAGDRIATVRRWGRIKKDPDGQVLKIWKVANGELLAEHRVEGFEFELARFSPDGKQLACGVQAVNDGLHCGAVLLNADTGEVLERLRGPFDWFTDFAFLPERDAIAIAVQGHTLRPLVLWELSAAEGVAKP